MYVEEAGRLTVRDQAGNRIAEFETEGFYPYRKARLDGGSLALFKGVRFSYKGVSGGDNHRVYKTRNGFISCSDHSVAIGVSACLF